MLAIYKVNVFGVFWINPNQWVHHFSTKDHEYSFWFGICLQEHTGYVKSGDTSLFLGVDGTGDKD